MAYRNPAFIARHLAAEVGVSGITSSTTAAGQGVQRLIDYRLSVNMKFNAAAANQFVQYDLGGDQTASRLVIPDGHNLSGASFELRAGAANPPTTVRASGSFGLGLNEVSFSEVVARYWRLVILTSGQWEFGELWLGHYRQTATGPKPGWSLPVYTPAVVRSFSTREAVLISGARRRRVELEHVGLSGTDLAIYDQIVALGVSAPFYFYAPDDTLGPLLVRLIDDADRAQDHPAPSVVSPGPTYTVKLRALEQTS